MISCQGELLPAIQIQIKGLVFARHLSFQLIKVWNSQVDSSSFFWKSSSFSTIYYSKKDKQLPSFTKSDCLEGSKNARQTEKMVDPIGPHF